jgi:hypothetical protein
MAPMSPQLVAVYWGWRHIECDGILRVAVYWGWRYIENGGILRVAIYWEWQYIESGGILRVAVYWEWKYIESGGILRVAVYSGRRYIFSHTDSVLVHLVFLSRLNYFQSSGESCSSCTRREKTFSKELPEFTVLDYYYYYYYLHVGWTHYAGKYGSGLNNIWLCDKCTEISVRRVWREEAKRKSRSNWRIILKRRLKRRLELWAVFFCPG